MAASTSSSSAGRAAAATTRGQNVEIAAGLRRLSEARSATEAFEHLSSHPCDLALIDCDVVRERWLGLVRQVRGARTTRQLPILLLVGGYEPAAVRAAIEVGVDGFLMNPVAPGLLRRRIGMLTSARSRAPLEAAPPLRVRLT